MSIFIFVFMLFCSFNASAQSFKDVPSTDPNYKAIEQAVKRGYLSFYQDQQFQPDKPLSRKEMALIIQKISLELDKFSQSGSSQ
jgi:hypothetical protein